MSLDGFLDAPGPLLDAHTDGYFYYSTEAA